MNPESAISDSPLALSSSPSVALPTLRIEPSKGWVPLKLNELWEYRELLYFLVWRDIKVRYKQTALGAAWAIIQPFLTMVVFSIFFANGLSQSSNSLVGSSHLITKVYFPRLIVPLGAVFSGIVDFLVAFAVLLAMMLYYGLLPSLNILWLPLFVLLALVTSLGVGLWLSALNVEYRDVRYVVPFITQFWLFATPIAYPSSLLHEPWRTIYGLNPMVGVVEGFRWALLRTNSAPGPIIAVSSGAAILILVTGAFYFRRMEKTFADIV